MFRGAAREHGLTRLDARQRGADQCRDEKQRDQPTDGKEPIKSNSPIKHEPRLFRRPSLRLKSREPAPDCGQPKQCKERPADDPRGCCLAKGSQELRDYMKTRVRKLKIQRTRVNASKCLDRCELGPTMVIYPEGVWYTYRSEADIDEILQTHLIGGGRVERLMLLPDQREPRN